LVSGNPGAVHGFAYLVTVLDRASRRVLAWQHSNTPSVDFFVKASETANDRYGELEIVKTDQGSQCTGAEYFSTVCECCPLRRGMAFIFSGLVVLTSLGIRAGYYDRKLPLYIPAISPMILIVAALLPRSGFAALGVPPNADSVRSVTDREFCALDCNAA
jgi:hypothetical protein|tara:strand:+ start:345 stop:824 length:480 start_codon:yes stop_codon:yes gene_type:complete